MRCPMLRELPAAPPGKTGWPWTEESPKVPDTMPDGSLWPRVTIVTPSYNQGQFIEETIRSVLLQGYADLEYIIMDGGSTDGSAEIIRKYEPWLAYWVSEPDRGQADAIQKGFERSTGEILAWLNSDDRYFPLALVAVGEFVGKNPKAELIVGNSTRTDHGGRLLNCRRPCRITFDRLLFGYWGLTQPATFWRRKPFFEVGGLDTDLEFCLDLDLFLKLLARKPARRLDRYLAAPRVHPASKSSTMQDTGEREAQLLYARHGREQRPVLHGGVVRLTIEAEYVWRAVWWKLLSLVGRGDRLPSSWVQVQ